MRVAFIFSDKRLTRFMQDADLFESFKVLVKNTHAILTVETWGLEQTEKVIKTCEPTDYGLVACYSIDHIYWIDPAIKVVSTGTSWALVEDYVRHFQQDLALDNDKNSAWHVGLPNE